MAELYLYNSLINRSKHLLVANGLKPIRTQQLRESDLNGLTEEQNETQLQNKPSSIRPYSGSKNPVEGKGSSSLAGYSNKA